MIICVIAYTLWGFYITNELRRFIKWAALWEDEPSDMCATLILKHYEKGKGKVQGVPQSQTAALPRPQEEEETDKSKQAQTKQMYEKHKN